MISCKGEKVTSHFVLTFKTGFLLSTRILPELPLDVCTLNKQEPNCGKMAHLKEWWDLLTIWLTAQALA